MPNYLLLFAVAHFHYDGHKFPLRPLLCDEAFYGIDTGRRDQLLGFASGLGLQLLVASPEQDGVRKEVPYSTTVIVVKDEHCDVHLHHFHWANPANERQFDLFDESAQRAGVTYIEESAP